MIRFIIRQWKQFTGWCAAKWSAWRSPPYRTVRVEELPEQPAKRTLYILGEGEHQWFVAMICPCGCGEVLQMGILADARPRWTVSVDANGIPSLSPSVWRQVGCKSHFFLIRGQIQWCG